MNQKTKFSFLFAAVLLVVFSLASVAMAKNDNAKSQSQGKSKSKTVNLKNFEKADKNKGTTNAQIHKEKSEEITQVLTEVADKEDAKGNTDVSDQIESVVNEQEQAQEEATNAIEQVEKRGKVKTFLLGTNYKNLGQLRSNLVHNRNEIRKLTQSLSDVQAPENQALAEAQLVALMLERERIKTIVMTNESSFSLFGWVSRFLNNYEQAPINEQDESDLTEEVENAIDNAAAETTPVVEIDGVAAPAL